MPRVEVKSIGGLKPSSTITKTFRVAADRLYDAYLLDTTPTKRFGIFDRAYTKFVVETKSEFEKMAVSIHRMWSLPEAVEPQDCLQDLHVEIARILGKYDPEKATVAAFLVWNAFARAKNKCNKQHTKSKFLVPLSRLSLTGKNGEFETLDETADRLKSEDVKPSIFIRTSDEKLDFDRMIDSLSESDRVAVLRWFSTGHGLTSIKTKQTLRQLLITRSALECEDDEQDPKIDDLIPKPKQRSKPRKTINKSNTSTGIGEPPIKKTIRSGKSESRTIDAAATWAAARRKSRRENEEACVLLCA